MPTINQNLKDRLFGFLFGNEANKAWTLSLYNAVNGTEYSNPEDIQITTIDDAIYMGMKNDLSFILFYVMNLYEQQSTFNPNMPVRQFMYAGRLYDKYIQVNHCNLYTTKIIKLPIPKLVVFYNGTQEMDDTILRLSDAFEGDIEPDIEVRVNMININYGKNHELMKACQPLAEYSWLVERIRQNRVTMDIHMAVDKAIDAMPKDYLIRSFVIGNKAEVKTMCITEYNEVETMQMFKEEGREEGLAEGFQQGIEQGIEQGAEQLGRLINALIANGRIDEVQKVTTDKQMRDNLYKEFNIL